MRVLVKTARICAVVIVLLYLTVALARCCYKNFPKVEVCVKHDPSQSYTLHISQIGIPGFPFGSVTTELVVKNGKGKTLDKCRFELNNDGTPVTKYNLKEIRWQSETVEIEMKGADDEFPTTYILELTN